MKVVIGCVIFLLIVIVIVFGILPKIFTAQELDALTKGAPLAIATIALVAACTALAAMYVQRDTAQRRAAVDFFLKTETDDNLITAYADFERLLADLPRIIATPNLSYSNADYRAMRKWLNLCELIATGVKLEAFSYKVTYAYWGYVLLDTYTASLPLITHIRATPSLGGPNTFCDLQWLAEKFAKTDDRQKKAAPAAGAAT